MHSDRRNGNFTAFLFLFLAHLSFSLPLHPRWTRICKVIRICIQLLLLQLLDQFGKDARFLATWIPSFVFLVLVLFWFGFFSQIKAWKGWIGIGIA